jgi:predicted dehydrogenase
MKAKVIGAGSIGNHLSNALRVLGHDVTLCDVDPAALQRTKTEIYPTRYGRWDDGIDLCLAGKAPRGGFDLIVVGTPPDSHIALALAALEEAPRAILIEKPVCTPSLEGVNELLARANAQGCRLFVGYDHVVGQAANRFSALVNDGVAGDVETLDVEFREHWGGIFAAHPWLDGPSDSYLGYWQRGGGAAGEHSHAFNLWQHFAHQLGKGRVAKLTATLDYLKANGTDYDRLCLANLVTEQGLVGRVVQDVVTRPSRKWARMQGSHGYVEWHCGFEPGKDAIVYARHGENPVVETIAKTRPDDFMLELKHIFAVMDRQVNAQDLSIERGLDTMMLIAAAHKSSQHGKSIVIDWSKTYSSAALCCEG